MVEKALIKSISQEFKWSQADVLRAIESSQDEVSSYEEIVACMIHYAGPTLLERNRRLGAQKATGTKQKKLIEDLVSQLVETKELYLNQFAPKSRAVIREQAEYIRKLLQRENESSG